MASEHSTTKRDYMTREGFALTTDVSNRMLEDLSLLRPEELPEHSDTVSHFMRGWDDAELPTDSAVALCSVASYLAKPMRYANDHSFMFEQTYGISRADKKQADNFFAVGRGMTTQDFTWHAAPAVAVATVHAFEAEGAIAPEQRQQMTLHDWANIIGTGWFSGLMHSMAFARNGTYGVLGMSGEDLQSKGLMHRLKGEIPTLDVDMPPFVVQEEYEPIEDMWYTTASLSDGLRNVLRGTLTPEKQTKENHKDSSPGCPGARYAATHDKHVQSLMKRGELVVDPQRSTQDKIRATQEYSAIDKYLILLATKLDQYQSLYGMPQIDRFVAGGAVTHTADIQNIDALRRKNS